MAQAIAIPADPAAPAAKQVNDHENDEDRSKRYGAPPRLSDGQSNSAGQLKKNGIPGPPVPHPEPKLGMKKPARPSRGRAGAKAFESEIISPGVLAPLN